MTEQRDKFGCSVLIYRLNAYLFNGLKFAMVFTRSCEVCE